VKFLVNRDDLAVGEESRPRLGQCGAAGPSHRRGRADDDATTLPASTPPAVHGARPYHATRSRQRAEKRNRAMPTRTMSVVVDSWHRASSLTKAVEPRTSFGSVRRAGFPTLREHTPRQHSLGGAIRSRPTMARSNRSPISLGQPLRRTFPGVSADHGTRSLGEPARPRHPAVQISDSEEQVLPATLHARVCLGKPLVGRSSTDCGRFACLRNRCVHIGACKPRNRPSITEAPGDDHGASESHRTIDHPRQTAGGGEHHVDGPA
jgi:hypothetical protein